MTALRRRASIAHACTRGEVPRWAADLTTRRITRCKRRRCASRYAVVRVSLDMTGERVDRLATLECALCGRTLRRITPPSLRSADGWQAVLIDLILPSAGLRRWRSRGRWHREGDNSTVLRNATLADVDEAARTHGDRADRILAARERARERRREAEREAAEAARALMARIAEREAAEADSETAAAAREAAYAA